MDGTSAVDFTLAPGERYGFIGRTVRRFMYRRLKRAQKAVVLRFLERVSGYSRQQLTRLVKRGAEHAPLRTRYRGSRTSFATHYTAADVLALAHTDSLHGTPVLLPRSSWSAPGSCSAIPAMSVWPQSPSLTCITCASVKAISAIANCGPRPNR